MSNRLQVTEFLIEANTHLEGLRTALTSAGVRAESFNGIVPSFEAQDLLGGITALRDLVYDDDLDVRLEALVEASARVYGARE